MHKTRYYVSRKNALTWICALLLLAGAFLHIAAVTFWKGEGVSDGNRLWFGVVCPVAALLIYVLQILTNANQNFYKTAIPVWIMCLSCGMLVNGNDMDTTFKVLFWVLYLVIATTYTVVTAGYTKRDWSLLLAFGGPLGYSIAYWSVNFERLLAMDDRLIVLAQMLELLGCLLLVFAIKVHNDGRYHPTWGDRKDGRKLRSLDPITTIGVYIMPNRNGANNSIVQTLDITETEKFIRRKRSEGMKEFGMNDVLLAALVRTFAKYPGMNRFISGQKIYSRDEDIQFCMTVKKDMTLDGSESILKLHLHPKDTVQEVYEKFHAAVHEIKDSPLDSDFDNTAKYLTFIPGLLLKFVMWLLKTLDYFGLLPKFLLEVSPFHSSIYLTSMGSLGIPAIVHHLYDFGNVPIFVAFGTKRRVVSTNEDGTTTVRRIIDYSFNLDERTVDGFYYATALKYFQRLLRHPDVLEQPPEKVVRDVD